ncbi:MAG: hypothetical protein VX730_07665 [Pseudomonadota bacterium]|nr:hypothetical protein [Pseudomonadota bacterium]
MKVKTLSGSSFLERLVGGFFSHLNLISNYWVLMVPAFLATVAVVAVLGRPMIVFAYATLSMGVWAGRRVTGYEKTKKNHNKRQPEYKHYESLSSYYLAACIFFFLFSVLATILALHPEAMVFAPVVFVFTLAYTWIVLPPETPRDSLMTALRKWINNQDEAWNKPTED